MHACNKQDRCNRLGDRYLTVEDSSDDFDDAVLQMGASRAAARPRLMFDGADLPAPAPVEAAGRGAKKAAAGKGKGAAGVVVPSAVKRGAFRALQKLLTRCVKSACRVDQALQDKLQTLLVAAVAASDAAAALMNEVSAGAGAVADALFFCSRAENRHAQSCAPTGGFSCGAAPASRGR